FMRLPPAWPKGNWAACAAPQVCPAASPVMTNQLLMVFPYANSRRPDAEGRTAADVLPKPTGLGSVTPIGNPCQPLPAVEVEMCSSLSALLAIVKSAAGTPLRIPAQVIP